MRSLQRRAIMGGLVWTVIAVAIGSLALFSIFEAIAQRRFDAALQDRHLQVVAALGNAGSGEAAERFLTDPAYNRPYSGRYWQIDGAGGVLASRSLFDFQFALPDEVPGDYHQWSGRGPNGPVRGARQVITLDDGSVWTVSVAESLSALIGERREVRRNVAIAFGLVGALMILGAALQTSIILRPIRKLREDVVHRWDAGKALEADDYPSEVAPLVEDINALLRRNREIVDRGRRQAADLAHALKTPSAVLRNGLEGLGQATDVAEPMAALDRIDAQIGRSLARIRAESASKGVNLRTDLETAIARLERLFRTMPDTRETALAVDVTGEIVVPVDQQDLEEMLGNVLENAFKWAAGRVSLAAYVQDRSAVIEIEDDGPGIARRKRDLALAPGARLDTTVPGTGLGLAITHDLAQAYGGTLQLERSERLGGLKVVIGLPLTIAGLAILAEG
ncbi:ATP-binding protein [Aestuariibius sp. 2305UL40-4]|uniref:ATP-binding protein n=1 Tax=Aestuariibius violaceus TaxID=3234132 RepID=UPI00345E86CB